MVLFLRKYFFILEDFIGVMYFKYDFEFIGKLSKIILELKDFYNFNK